MGDAVVPFLQLVLGPVIVAVGVPWYLVAVRRRRLARVAAGKPNGWRRVYDWAVGALVVVLLVRVGWSGFLSGYRYFVGSG